MLRTKHTKRALGVALAGLSLLGTSLAPIAAVAAPATTEVTVDQEATDPAQATDTDGQDTAPDPATGTPVTAAPLETHQDSVPDWAHTADDGTPTLARDLEGFSGVSLETHYDQDLDGLVATWRAPGEADHFTVTPDLTDEGSLTLTATPDASFWDASHEAATVTAGTVDTTLDANGGTFADGTASREYKATWTLADPDAPEADTTGLSDDEAARVLRADDIRHVNPTATTDGTYEAPTREGYTLTGWNTKADGTGDSYPDAAFARYAGVPLYAQWRADTYTVAFDGNGGSGTQDAISATYDADATLPEPAFTYDGMDFVGYNTEPDGTGTTYYPGDAVRNLTDKDGDTVTLYAQWDANVSISVPTTVPFHVKADGTVITPSNWSIKNVGRSMVQTTDVSVDNASGSVSYAAQADGADWFDVADGTAETTGHVTLAPGEEKAVTWSMDAPTSELEKGEDGLAHVGTISIDYTRVATA